MKNNAHELAGLVVEEEDRQLCRKLESASLEIEKAFVRGTSERPNKLTAASVTQQTQMRLAIEEYDSSLNEIIRRVESTPNREVDFRKQLRNAIAYGALFNVALTVLVGTVMGLGIKRRLKALTDNCHLLREGHILNAGLSGNDELAQVDGVLHDISRELARMRVTESEAFKDSLDIFFSLDRDCRFVKVSPSARTVWGYSADELSGRYAMELADSHSVDATMRELKGIVERKDRGTFENGVTRKDGSRVDMLWSAHWSEKHGLVLCACHDITEQKRSQVQSPPDDASEKPTHPSQSASARLGPLLNASQSSGEDAKVSE